MNHEKLRCYQQLMEVAGGLAKKMSTWPRGHGYLEDQMRRAISSAILTLSEGNGKRNSYKERRRFFEMSMGSIAEVASCLDLAAIFCLIPKRDEEEMKAKLRLSYYQIRKLP
jgi:four helix bundle protein